jgi:DNA-binding transcriptional regulator YhcF (GntR family)
MEHLWRQIIIDRSDPLPPYQQICNALRHKIATNQLSTGAVLPSIRLLAQVAAVTPATVARAYRTLQEEGLVEARVGVGTVVVEIVPTSQPLQSRVDLETEIGNFLRGLGRRGYARDEIRQAFERQFNRAQRNRRVAFVAHAPSVVKKYSRLLESELRDLGISVIPVTLCGPELSPNDRNSLAGADHIITLLSFLRTVQALTEPLDLPVTVLLTELSLTTNRRLQSIPGGTKVALVAEAHYRTTGLGMLQPYCQPEQIVVVRDLDPSPLRAALTSVTLIVHTLGTGDLVKEVMTPDQQAIELEFQARSDSLKLIKDALAATES